MTKQMGTVLRRKVFKRILLLLVICFGILGIASAQVRISGTVTDAETGDPLPGVNVIEKETVNGTITDVDGSYSLTVEGSSSVVEFSFVGYETTEVTVGNGTVINVSLNVGVALDEVVVVGFGTQKKESVVGAITQVSGDELVSSGTNNVSTSISGKLSGVVTLQTDGKPGEEDPQIFVRGAATWNNTSPLIMVDGIERSSWSDIDPNEIASISVLKDASATAVYGAKGGNGVILITTKRGIQGKPKFNFTYSHGFKQVSSNMEMLDAYETLTNFNRALRNDNQWGSLFSQEELMHYRDQDMPYIYPSVKWVDEMFKLGHTDNASLNVRGGTENVDYFVSIGYLFDGDVINTEKQGDFDPRNYYNRYNLRSNLDFKLTNTTTLSTNIAGSVQIRNRPSVMNRSGNSVIWSSIFTSAVNASPVIYPASLLEQYPDPNEPDANEDRYVFNNNGQIFDNPISMINTTGFENEKQSILNTDMVLKQDLGMITEGLSAKATVSYGADINYQRTYGFGAFTEVIPLYRLTLYPDDSYIWQRQPDYHEDVQEMSFNGESQDFIRRNLYYDAQINYQRNFGGAHYVTALAVFRRKQRNVGTQEPFKEEAWSGRITYAYKLKYLFESNLGYTGSEQFAPENRFGFFPAYAVGWNIGEEDFIKDNLAFMNRLKVRYSYGKVGVDNASRWLYYQNYSAGDISGAHYANGTLGAYGNWYEYYNSYIEGPVANIVAQWETAIKQNLGVEVGLFDKINLSVDLFKEDRNDILEVPHTIPDFAALEFKALNLGITKSHGYEIELGYDEKFASGIYLNLNGKYSFSENRVVFRDDPPGVPMYQRAAGFPIGQPSVRLSAGRYGSVDDINNYTHPGTNTTYQGDAGYTTNYEYVVGDEKFVDYNGDGVIDANDAVPDLYPSYPLTHFSFRGLIRYKGFSARILVMGQLNKTSSLDDLSVPLNSSYPFMFAHERDYYSINNPGAFYPALHTGVYGQDNSNNPAYSRPISSFLRLREVELSYDFKLNKNSAVKNLSLFLNGNNLFTYAPNVNFGDPEKPGIRPTGASNSYPLIKRYNMGLKLGF
jgi:TonB-linked SusC/RagA family outer membrane protein